MYLFYIGNLLLPVTPSSYTLKEKNRNRIISLVNGNEVSLPETAGLCEIGFSALLPMVEYPFSVYEGGFKDGIYFASALRSMKQTALPLGFKILRSGMRRSTDMQCVIDELSFKEDAENGGDITCNIVLRQYRGYASSVIDTDSGSVKTADTDRQIPKSVKVSKGDTLWTVAKRYYGDGSRYPELYAKNADIIESCAKQHSLPCSENGRYIYEGTELVL